MEMAGGPREHGGIVGYGLGWNERNPVANFCDRRFHGFQEPLMRVELKKEEG